MSLNTTQKLAVMAVLGGLVTLPVVYAMTDDPMTELIKNKQGTQLKQPPMNGIVNVEDGKTTQTQFSQIQTITNSSQVNSMGPAAHNGLQSRDIPANEWQAQSQPSNFDTTNGNYAQSASCAYYSGAGKLGIYHFSFPEASAADLVTINGYKVNRMAADNLRRMIADARSQGVTLTIGSAFRSVDYQRGIVSRKKTAGQSLSKIYYVSSHPGFSEHHTGLAIDFTPINHGFARSPGYGWLKNNARNYGFEQTFTPSYSQATGVSEESWHWKYTGSPQAQAMLANSQCYLKPRSQWHAAS